MYFVFLSNDVEDGSFLGRTALVEGINQRKRNLLLVKVIPGRFSKQIRFLKIKEVVLDLKGNSGILSKQSHPFNDLFILRDRTGSDRRTGRHQRGGFLADDLKIDLFRDIQLSGLLNLKDLSFAHLPDGRRDEMQDVVILVFDRPEQSFCENEISNQYRNFIFPNGIHR